MQNSNKNLSLAICILFFNKADQTVECVESFGALGMPIYILNNNSDPSASKKVKAFCEKFSHVTYFDSDKNLGVSGGRNYLIDKTEEEWILFVDNDITIKDLDHFRAFYPEIVALGKGCDALSLPLFNVHDNKYMHHLSILINDQRQVQLHRPEGDISNMFAGGASLIRRSFFERVGVYDSEMFVGFEDYEIALRAIKLGDPLKVKIVSNGPELLHDHRYSSSKVDHEAVKIRYSADHIAHSEEIMVQKYDIVFPVDWRDWAKEQIDQITKKKNQMGILIPSMVCGGSEKVTSTVIKTLAENDYDVFLITEGENNVEILEELKGSIASHFDLSEYHSLEEKQVILLEYLKNEKLDFIVGVNSSLFLHSLFEFDKFRDLKVVDVIHGASNSWYFYQSVFYNELIDFHICISKLIARELESSGVDTSKIKIIENGIDTEYFDSGEVIRQKDLTIGYLGRLTDEKNPLLFVDVACEYREENVHWVMAGSGVLKQECKKKVRDCKVENFTFLGEITEDEVKDFLMNVDILLLTSKREGLPLVVLEAMSMGVCVIVSDVGALSDIIKNGTNGFIVQKQEPEAFIAHIEEYSGYPENYTQLSDNARNTVIEHHSIKNMQEAYLDFFDSQIHVGHTKSKQGKLVIPESLINEQMEKLDDSFNKNIELKVSLEKYKSDAKVLHSKINVLKQDNDILTEKLKEAERNASKTDYQISDLLTRTKEKPLKFFTLPLNLIRIILKNED